MKPKGKLPFDPKVFLSSVNGGRSKSEYPQNQIVFRHSSLLSVVLHDQPQIKT